MTIQELLETIAALPEAERADLLARLRELYGVSPPPKQMDLGLTTPDWTDPADYLLVFDGGSRGNPGEGYGSYALFEGGRPGAVRRVDFPDVMTNNEAEYRTLLAALDELLKTLGPRAAASTLEIRGDSALVLQQVQGHWKAKEDRMRQYRDQVRDRLRKLRQWRMVQQPREDSVRVLGH